MKRTDGSTNNQFKFSGSVDFVLDSTARGGAKRRCHSMSATRNVERTER